MNDILYNNVTNSLCLGKKGIKRTLGLATLSILLLNATVGCSSQVILENQKLIKQLESDPTLRDTYEKSGVLEKRLTVTGYDKTIYYLNEEYVRNVIQDELKNIKDENDLKQQISILKKQGFTIKYIYTVYKNGKDIGHFYLPMDLDQKKDNH